MKEEIAYAAVYEEELMALEVSTNRRRFNSLFTCFFHKEGYECLFESGQGEDRIVRSEEETDGSTYLCPISVRCLIPSRTI